MNNPNERYIPSFQFLDIAIVSNGLLSNSSILFKKSFLYVTTSLLSWPSKCTPFWWCTWEKPISYSHLLSCLLMEVVFIRACYPFNELADWFLLNIQMLSYKLPYYELKFFIMNQTRRRTMTVAMFRWQLLLNGFIWDILRRCYQHVMEPSEVRAWPSTDGLLGKLCALRGNLCCFGNVTIPQCHSSDD